LSKRAPFKFYREQKPQSAATKKESESVLRQRPRSNHKADSPDRPAVMFWARNTPIERAKRAADPVAGTAALRFEEHTSVDRRIPLQWPTPAY
jgi:hypothetical protein